MRGQFTISFVNIVLFMFLFGLFQCSLGHEKASLKTNAHLPSKDASSTANSKSYDKNNDITISGMNKHKRTSSNDHQDSDELHRKTTSKELSSKNVETQQSIDLVKSKPKIDSNVKNEAAEKYTSKVLDKPDDGISVNAGDLDTSNSRNGLSETAKDESEASLLDIDRRPADRFVTHLEHRDSEDPDLDDNIDHTAGLKDSQEPQPIDDITSPLPSSQELSDEEKIALENDEKSTSLYLQGMKLINSSTSRSSVTKGYQLLRDAADLGHGNAEVEIGFAHLMGAYLPLQIVKAREIFEKHAATGNPRAQAGLGVMYATGIGTNSSQARALVYLTFSALGNDVMGRMILGYRSSSGIGVAKSCEAALNYYRGVADQVAANVKPGGGSILMRVRLLDEVDRPGSSYGVVDEDLVQYYQFLADKGDIPAQVTLGQLNYQGSQGFEQNHAKAFEYFSKAAEAGNANAMGYLGKIYSEGTETVKQSNTTALKYFKQAAEKGNPIGHAGLGLMYLYGKGVEKSHEKAFKHFQSSADQGWPEGQLHLGNLYFNGLGVKRDFKHALRYFNLAAQNGHLLALYYLAKMHATGNGVPRNCQTATELYKNVCERGRWSSMFELAYKQYRAGRVDSSLATYMLLAELGYEVAQSNAAYILDQEQSGLFPNQTYTRALIHWDRAAEQGYSTARLKLGDYHYYGKGTEVDYEIAASHYKIAVEQSNNAQAMFNIGYMHEQGLGMKRDIHLAKRHYDMAAEASADAVVPVTLALFKLALLFALEFFETKQWLYSSQLPSLYLFLPDDWDLYLMTFLTLVLGFVVAYRRQRR